MSDIMDVYMKIAPYGCFTREDMVRVTGSESAAGRYIGELLRKGCAERMCRDLYAVMDGSGWPAPSRFRMASCLPGNSYVSHHTAFEYYGCANQMYYDVHVSSERRIKPFEYGGMRFVPIASRGDVGIAEDRWRGVRVTTLERTVVEGVADFRKYTGLEELLRCVSEIRHLSADGLLESLAMFGCERVYRDTGFLLESLNDDLGLPESFFEECERHVPGARGYLFTPRGEDFVFHRRWNLYAPGRIKGLIAQGVTDYAGS